MEHRDSCPLKIYEILYKLLNFKFCHIWRVCQICPVNFMLLYLPHALHHKICLQLVSLNGLLKFTLIDRFPKTAHKGIRTGPCSRAAVFVGEVRAFLDYSHGLSSMECFVYNEHFITNQKLRPIGEKKKLGAQFPFFLLGDDELLD